MQASHPAPPWSLRGTAIAAWRLVPTSVARALVPARLRIVPVLPRHTIAVLCMVRYEEGSALRYHELIAAPALVHAAGRIGAWVSHIYVDSPASMAAGRSIWGLPKQLAEFAWARQSVRMVEPDIRMQVLHEPTRVTRLRVPLLAPVFGEAQLALKWALGKGSCRLARVRGSVSVSQPDLRALGFERVRTLIRIDDFRLTLPAPAIVGHRGVK